jgi:hypothetical protein
MISRSIGLSIVWGAASAVDSVVYAILQCTKTICNTDLKRILKLDRIQITLFQLRLFNGPTSCYDDFRNSAYIP